MYITMQISVYKLSTYKRLDGPSEVYVYVCEYINKYMYTWIPI